MPYADFCAKVRIITALADSDVDFSHDAETGKHFAHCSDGVVITGNTKSVKITVRWGSGHVAQAAI